MHRLGVDRGIAGFRRFVFTKRFGRNHLAVPLGHVRVVARPQAEWLDELDPWLDRFRNWASRDNAPNSARQVLGRLETVLFDLAGARLHSALVQRALVALAEAQHLLAVRATAGANDVPPPVPLLSLRWAMHADDHTPAFAIARALASVPTTGALPCMRAHLWPVDPAHPERWAQEQAHAWQPWRARLVPWLAEVLALRARLVAAHGGEQERITARGWGAGLAQIAAFLADARMDAAVARLLPALALVRSWQHEDAEAAQRAGVETALVPRGWARIALACSVSAEALRLYARLEAMPHPAKPAALLARGKPREAEAEARRQLAKAGALMSPYPSLWRVDARRAAAALLVPLAPAAERALCEMLLATETHIPAQGGM